MTTRDVQDFIAYINSLEGCDSTTKTDIIALYMKQKPCEEDCYAASEPMTTDFFDEKSPLDDEFRGTMLDFDDWEV